MGTKEITDHFRNLNTTENKDINILLLGETGVGKSTFVNSIANYLHFKSFKKASKEELLVLIPSLITLTNEHFEQITIPVGSADKNEYQEVGAAGTQDVKTYVFPLGEGKTRLRLIDTPGMGDPRGIQQDDLNCDNILLYLAQLKELHAICFLMKPTTTRITVFFEYCVKQILSRLEKSASNNIIFIFTNTRGTNYTPGDTLPCLKKVVEDIKAQPPHVDIPLKNNTFSFDNEAFRYLVATKYGINYDESVQKSFLESWNNSSKECWKLISYIIGDASHDGLKPHQIQNTTSINEARRLIIHLSQPMADISQLIYDNIRILEKHKHNLRMDNQSLDALKQKLYIPIINLQVTELTQPVTVCTSTKCADVVNVGDVKKWHYKQRCHDPCYLTNVSREFVGDPNLQHCAAMNGGRICVKCTCDFSVHMHVYYMTKTVDDKIVDGVVQTNIHQKETALREAQRLIGEIDRRKKELEDERETIIRSTAQFAHFLQHNAITPFNDSYKAYIEYLITREKGLGRHSDSGVIMNLEELLHQYEEIKAAFDTSLKLNQQIGGNNAVAPSVSAPIVMQTVHKLYQLKHNGKKIKELMTKQKSSRKLEYDKNCEYVHPKASGIDKKEKVKTRKGSKTDDERKKVCSKTDDEQKKAKKNKGSKTDDEKKNVKGQKPHFNQSRFSRERQQQVPQRHDPPPPYSAHSSNYPNNYSYSNRYSEPSRPVSPGRPEVQVKVQVNQPHQHGSSSYDPYCTGPCCRPPSQYQSPQEQYNRPPHQGHNYQEPFHHGPSQHHYGSFQGPYYGASHGQHHGPPHGQYHGPPQGQQYGPPPNHQYAPPQGQQYGPPSNHQYAPPQGHQYHAPPQEPPQGHYQQGAKQGYYQQGHNQGGHRGRPFINRGRGRGRAHSKPRYGKDKKSGNEKSSRSSSSESSD